MCHNVHSYCGDPSWMCWSIGVNTSTPLNISNNQPIERWHKQVMKLLNRSLRGATEHVLQVSFPRMVLRDASSMPKNIRFELPLEWITEQQYKTALKVLMGEDRFVAVVSEEVTVHRPRK